MSVRMSVTVCLCLLASRQALAQAPTEQAPFPRELVTFRGLRSEPVFAGRGSGYWDASIRERGWILQGPDGYRMWYTGYDGTRDGIRQMGFATSPDGIHWTRRDAPLLPGVWVEDMMILPHAGRLLMFAEGANDQAQMLESTDGLQWQQRGRLDVRLTSGEPIPPGPFGTPTVIHADDRFHLFYERRDAGVWLATSTDLKVWTNVSDSPLLTPGPQQHDQLMIAMNMVIKRGDWYYALYHGTGTPMKPRQWCPCIAASRDLRVWQKYAGNPLLPVAENKSSGIFVGRDDQLRLFTMHGRVDIHEPVPPAAQ